MPAAGLGSRFKDVYNKPKPLIDVYDYKSPMFNEAIRHSFNPSKVIIVTRKDLDFYNDFRNEAEIKGYTFVGLDKITDGQAITVKEGLKYANDGAISINSCDQGILFDQSKLETLFSGADVIICGIKNYAPAIRKANSFSWIKSNGDDVIEITSKRCDGDPKESLVFVSCLLYKSKEILENSIDSLISRGKKVNNEYYIDESINDSIALGYKVKVLEIDAYLNWGTPEELSLFQWWNNFFKVVGNHGYMA
jgi:choline kinase